MLRQAALQLSKECSKRIFFYYRIYGWNPQNLVWCIPKLQIPYNLFLYSILLFSRILIFFHYDGYVFLAYSASRERVVIRSVSV